jgi:hypothetical protein
VFSWQIVGITTTIEVAKETPAMKSAKKKNKSKILTVSYLCDGERQSVDVEVSDSGEPDEVLIEDAEKFVQTLEDNRQLAHGTGPLPPGTTHRIETRPDGTRLLTRKRFSLSTQ